MTAEADRRLARAGDPEVTAWPSRHNHPEESGVVPVRDRWDSMSHHASGFNDRSLRHSLTHLIPSWGAKKKNDMKMYIHMYMYMHMYMCMHMNL